MNEESGKRYKSSFIPCGDALEKMELFADAAQERAEGSDCICKTEETVEKNSD